jgi:hypothetical protein
MSRSGTRAALKIFLQGLSKSLFVIGGLCFLFGDRAFIAFGKMDFVLAELLGIGTAALCIGAGAVAHYKIEDIEWQEGNEEAIQESQKPPKS